MTNQDAAYDLTKLFQLSLDLLCVAGMDGYYKLVNPAFTQTLGYTEEELLRIPFMDFVHPEDRAHVSGEMERLAAGKSTVNFENRVRCADGSFKWLAWRGRPTADGKIYGVARDVTEDKARQEAERRRLHREACIDSLTGLLNRRGLEGILGRLHETVAVLIDLDNFKSVNDRCGHARGDLVIKDVGVALQSAIRPTDPCARVGGDEFIVLLPVATWEGGLRVAERIRTSIELVQVLDSDDQLMRVTASLGVVKANGDTRTVTDLLRRTQKVLSRSKTDGKNRVAWSEPPPGVPVGD